MTQAPPFEMRFDPRTIKHLGVKMYSTLPPALAEIIANSYDADAHRVTVKLHEDNGQPSAIEVIDDGSGLSQDEIRDKFLIIGRDRREDDGDQPSPKYGRMPIGKKGLGKLALFGLAKKIQITTVNEGKRNTFLLDWDALTSSSGTYHPIAIELDAPTDSPDGTTVTLTNLKRKSRFDASGLADSLSRYFIIDATFSIKIIGPDGQEHDVTNARRYKSLTVQFQWDIDDPESNLIPETSPYHGLIKGRLITAKKPIPPSSQLRGITLFSRKKLVNLPEFFSVSTSSHFFQYLTGWITVDFIDDLGEDVISTNRQSLEWDHPEMTELRTRLSSIVAQVGREWREKRIQRRDDELAEEAGIDTKEWIDTMPANVQEHTRRILDYASKEEAADNFKDIVHELYAIIPKYPLLHWRHLHSELRGRVKEYYTNRQYGHAAEQATQIFCENLKNLTNLNIDGQDLVNKCFGSPPFKTPPRVQLNALSSESETNIQIGQGHLSRGLITGFRNPINHDPMDRVVPGVFSELDCLNILSLVSYLLARLDNAQINQPLSRGSIENKA